MARCIRWDALCVKSPVALAAAAAVIAALSVLATIATSCDDGPAPGATDGSAPLDASSDAALDADLDAAPDLDASPEAAAHRAVTCPPDMVRVLDRYCVDRFEISLIDADSELPLSPYYPPLPSFDRYLKEREAEGARLFVPSPENQDLAGFPSLPAWQRRGRSKPKAVSQKGVTPNAYLMMQWARDACIAAGKRLCSIEEWQTACRGEQNRQFPYGDEYKQGACNVFREDHPGRVLFGKVSVGMLDPRMNKVAPKGKPLLRKTGATPACKSVWGDDAIYDMVGNLDEWIDDPEGTFAGGFYSRTAKNGCEKTTVSHTATYFDYSTGGRCCADVREVATP